MTSSGLWSHLAPGITERADEFLFLGVDADDGCVLDGAALTQFGDVLELGVAARMRGAGTLLVVDPQRESHLLEKAGDSPRARRAIRALHGRCTRNNDRVGNVVRTATQGDYYNTDFPALRIFNRYYPAQVVCARHRIWININPVNGGLELRNAYRHWGDGNPSILAAYLLHIDEAHFRSDRVGR